MIRWLKNPQAFFLVLVGVILFLTFSASQLCSFWTFGYCSAAPQYAPTLQLGDDYSICTPGARYVAAGSLIDSLDASSNLGASFSHQELSGGGDGFPKIIHQSWKDRDLPVRFSKWSDSLRARHPDWIWVLWTDQDNERLVATHHPQLLASYQAFRSNVQRADMARNLYMWHFGGLAYPFLTAKHLLMDSVYADLDMECLRPLDSLFSDPPDPSLLNPMFPITLPSPSPALVYLGSMEHDARRAQQRFPNAFLASSRRHHPFWLLPLSSVLTHRGAWDWVATVEKVSGPVALTKAVEEYRGMVGSTGLAAGAEGQSELGDLVHPDLRPMLAESAPSHQLVIFENGILYPFSWQVNDGGEAVHRACRGERGTAFDPAKCKGELQYALHTDC